MQYNNLKFNRGFSLIEMMTIIVIITILIGGTVAIYIKLKGEQALSKDAELVVEVLRQARSQTLNSQNASEYGVHLSSLKITLFTGNTYSSGSASNVDFPLVSGDTILTISLNGGGSDVVFRRLSGETGEYGTVVLTSSASSGTKTVTIYKTGLVE